MSRKIKNKPEITAQYPLDGVAICQKDDNQVVQYQSSESISICGHKEGNECKDCPSHLIPPTPYSMASDHIYHHHQIYSRVMIQKDNMQTTILVPDGETEINIDSILNKAHLSPREREIAILISNTQSNAAIISKLVISESTLKTHLNSIYRKAPELKGFRERLRD